MQDCAPSPFRNLLTLTLVLMLSSLLFGFAPTSRSIQLEMHNMPDMAAHADVSDQGSFEQAKLLAYRNESEFNHHLAGIFILIGGIFIVAQERFLSKWSIVRYAWPLCFFVSGMFVLVFSDTEIWPWGDQSVYYALSHQPEDLQHKVFAIILLVLALVEFKRLRGQWKAAWQAWIFPALSLIGAVLLLFHSHAAGMQGPNAMQLMERIQSQHRWYASIGFAIVLTKGLSEMPIKWRNTLNRTWPLLLIILGISLALYRE
jgi:copper resistance protein D